MTRLTRMQVALISAAASVLTSAMHAGMQAIFALNYSSLGLVMGYVIGRVLGDCSARDSLFRGGVWFLKVVCTIEHAMRAILLTSLTAFAVLGCHHDSSKVERQKAIYFSVSDVPRRELEKEITRTMETQHLPTPGRAMIYLLDQSIAFLPRVDAMVEQAATKAGVRLPPKDPLDEAEAKIKLAREVRSMLQAREAIARIEAEVE